MVTWASELITDIKEMNDARDSLAFCVSSLHKSQLSLEIITTLNNYSIKNNDLDVYVYNIHPDPPIQIPLFSVYNRSSLYSHYGPLIVTDPFTCHATLQCPFAKIYYYVYDPLLLINVHEQLKLDILKENSNINYIARTKEHKKLLNRDLNIKCIDTLVYNVDINRFMEIINC